MKEDRSEVVCAVLLAAAVLAGIAIWDFEAAWLFMLATVPFFSVQLLCCLTKRWWTRILPTVPVVPLAGWTLYYLCSGRGGYLAPLVFLVGGAAPAAGAALAWGIWWFFDYRKRN